MADAIFHKIYRPVSELSSNRDKSVITCTYALPLVNNYANHLVRDVILEVNSREYFWQPSFLLTRKSENPAKSNAPLIVSTKMEVKLRVKLNCANTRVLISFTCV